MNKKIIILISVLVLFSACCISLSIAGFYFYNSFNKANELGDFSNNPSSTQKYIDSFLNNAKFFEDVKSYKEELSKDTDFVSSEIVKPKSKHNYKSESSPSGLIQVSKNNTTEEIQLLNTLENEVLVSDGASPRIEFYLGTMNIVADTVNNESSKYMITYYYLDDESIKLNSLEIGSELFQNGKAGLVTIPGESNWFIAYAKI